MSTTVQWARARSLGVGTTTTRRGGAVSAAAAAPALHPSSCSRQRLRQRVSAARRVAAAAAAEAGSAAAEARVQLGKSPLRVSPIGLGAWSWGDRSGYWGYKGYDKSNTEAANAEAYTAALDCGIDFIDTAEVYGFGLSEEILGRAIRATGSADRVLVATKFAPLPWRLTAGSVVDAARASLKRLDLPSMALYIQHWPGFAPPTNFCGDNYLNGLADVVEQRLATAVGVSNFSASRVRNAARLLEGRGTCLSSNQVQYSLLYREPERTGVLEACREHGVTLVAYSPICQGLLSGKYSADNLPSGPRRAFISGARLRETQVLLDLMRAIGAERGGKTCSQVALNWLMCQPGVVPIPGAKTAGQVRELAGALGWRLSDGEVAELSKVSAKIPSSSGAPFEKW